MHCHGAHRALCARCARAVPKVGCFPPPVATDPKVLNSAPYHPPAGTPGILFLVCACHGSQGPEFCTPCCFELIIHPSAGGWFSGVFPG